LVAAAGRAYPERVSATTIHAEASPPGSAERAVLRLSGPQALAAAALVFAPPLPRVRAQVDGQVLVRGRALPAFALVMPAPHSYTGEDVVELHLPGSPLLLAECERAFARHGDELLLQRAAPGEFTRRAFANGRIDLLQAEGVLLLVHGDGETARRRGLQWLHGGLSALAARVRVRLQDALALVEAGLDFTADETGAVPDGLWRPALAQALADLRALLAELPAASPGGEVLLLGAANAGKSSLCNALAGREEVLVDALPGTTRDLVRVELGSGVAMWDAPGDLEQPGDWDRAALRLRDQLGARAAAALLVVDPARWHAPATVLPLLAVVFTKADRSPQSPGLPEPAPPPPFASLPRFVTSARDGRGIEDLRAFLRARAGGFVCDPGGPLRQPLQQALAAAEAAAAVPAGAGGELIAVELQAALRQLDEVDGRHAPDDLLDRIFARFCLGK
jgi:tRNA modification GTPase